MVKPHASNPRMQREIRGHAEVIARSEKQSSKRTRLTDAQRADRLLSGTDLQHQITDLATIFGWYWSHWRAMKNGRGFWEVPVEGPLGKGWPDLFLIQPEKGRVLCVEVKRELGDPLTPDQGRVHDLLRRAGIEVRVWRPSDMSEGRIQEVLR